MTLVEISIAMFVLGLMMTMVVTAIASALQNGSRMSTQLEMLRQATAGVDLLERELRMCQQVYNPTPGGSCCQGCCEWPVPGSCGTPSLFNPDVGSSTDQSSRTPFVFVHPTYPTGGAGPYQLVVVGYQWNSQTSVLQRLEYDPGYNPKNVGTQIPLNNANWQLLAQNVSGFKLLRESNDVNQNTPSIGIQLTVSNGNYLSIPFNVCVPVERIGSSYVPSCCWCGDKNK
jgi:hypothetical protein